MSEQEKKDFPLTFREAFPSFKLDGLEVEWFVPKDPEIGETRYSTYRKRFETWDGEVWVEAELTRKMRRQLFYYKVKDSRVARKYRRIAWKVKRLKDLRVQYKHDCDCW